MKTVFVCNTKQILPQKPFIFQIEKYEQVIIFNSGEEFFAVENRCPHAGALLNESEIEGRMLTCIWHGWQFDLKSGRCLNDPWAQLKSYEINVKNGEVFLLLPEANKSEGTK